MGSCDSTHSPLPGESTLQRLESEPAVDGGLGRYHRIFHNPEAIERFFVEHFLTRYNGEGEPGQLIIDVDATDDPIHVNQEGRCLPQFLQQLLLSAALHVPGRLSVGGKASPVEHRHESLFAVTADSRASG
ncbi:MAG: hypothetical protein ACLFPO_06850 [Spirochaetaceae bacterium]